MRPFRGRIWIGGIRVGSARSMLAAKRGKVKREAWLRQKRGRLAFGRFRTIRDEWI
jgi:hypothetical protein